MATKMAQKILKNDLLFHPVHGLCRVSIMTQPEEEKELSYTLVPVTTNRGKIRFVLPKSALKDSGFSKLISTKEGKAILDYFKTGKKADSKNSQAWELAELICSESRGKESVKDARKRQRLDYAVKGLTNELAFVLKMSLDEVAEKIEQNLSRLSAINPLVMTALANIDRE